MYPLDTGHKRDRQIVRQMELLLHIHALYCDMQQKLNNARKSSKKI